jgi:hypothetical protein
MTNPKQKSLRHRMGQVLILVIFLSSAACSLQSNTLRPVEEEQIANVVVDYYTRNGALPEQEVTIEAVTEDWARVSMKPAGIEGTADIFYLQNQNTAVNPAPTAELIVQPGDQARTTTTTGWVIIIGPQVTFSDEELDAVGVPPALRP